MFEFFNGKSWLIVETFFVLLGLLVWVTYRYITLVQRCKRDNIQLNQTRSERDGWRLAANQAIGLAEDGTEQNKHTVRTLEALRKPERPHEST